LILQLLAAEFKSWKKLRQPFLPYLFTSPKMGRSASLTP